MEDIVRNGRSQPRMVYSIFGAVESTISILCAMCRTQNLMQCLQRGQDLIATRLCREKLESNLHSLTMLVLPIFKE